MVFATWTYDDGQQYVGSWISLILLLAPTVFFNFSTFLLLSYSPQLTRSSSSLLVRILCLEDAVYALCCLVSCIVNFHHSGIYGDHVGCEIQATYMLFFQLSTGYTLCCVAYNSERKVAGKRGLSQRQVWLTHGIIWTAAAAITVLSVVVVKPARVYPSGTFCLVAINELGPALLFWLPGLAVILAAITYRYALLYRTISRRSTLMEDQYAKTPAAAAAQLRQIAAAKRMAAIVASFLLSNFPFAVLGLYELCSDQDAPAIATIVFAWLIHLGSLINPILYVWLNRKIRTALADAAHRLIVPSSSVSPLHVNQQLVTSTTMSESGSPITRQGSSQRPPKSSISLASSTFNKQPLPYNSSPLQPSKRASTIVVVVQSGQMRPLSSSAPIEDGPAVSPVAAQAAEDGGFRQPTSQGESAFTSPISLQHFGVNG